jgi:hypothetical protein
MPGLVPGIHVFPWCDCEDVDGRAKPGHDGGGFESRRMGRRVSSCFETHRSAVRLRKQFRSRHAAMLLSMRARRGRCRRWTKNQPAGVRKWRGGGVPVSGLLFTGSCATAARGGDTRIEIRGGRFPRSRLSARCAGSAGMSERGGNLRVSKWESISHFYRNLQAAVHRERGARHPRAEARRRRA